MNSTHWSPIAGTASLGPLALNNAEALRTGDPSDHRYSEVRISVVEYDWKP